jgi:hypothetical protein
MIRFSSVLSCLLVAALAGCGAGARPDAAGHPTGQVAIAAPPALPEPAAPAAAPPAAPSGPVLSEAEVVVEAERLRAAYVAEVPHRVEDGVGAAAWIARAKAAIAASDQTIDRPQLLVIVDRNPRVQALRIVLARPQGEWEVIGGSRVSTGQTGRFDHYITPVGVFPHTDAILDFRAEGTFNENHIRGLGLHGMRVWDFGWQTASKGWLTNQSGPMRLLMHATDPANLEMRIGYRASSGCVRIPAAVNTFLDRHGVLDVDYERVARDDIRYRALLRRDRVPTPLAGNLMIVVDSGDRT